MTGGHDPSAHAWHIIQLILRTRNQPAQGLGANLWITVVFQDSAGTRMDVAGVGAVGPPTLAYSLQRLQGCPSSSGAT